MVRLIVAASAVLLGVAPAAAATYSAKPAVAVSGKFIARDITWNCGPAACQGATSESRPTVLCQALAKHAGRIETFTVDGRELASAELAKCNTAAKTTAVSAAAAQ